MQSNKFSKNPGGVPRLTNQAGGNIQFENDELLFANEFVKDSYQETPKDLQSNYKIHAEQQRLSREKKERVEQVKKMNNPVQVQVHLPDKSEVYQKRATPFAKHVEGPGEVVPGKARWRQVKRKIFVDSRDRDLNVYQDASDFVINWGRVYQNVLNMKLVSLEFPNVVQSVSIKNNMLNWINFEDIQLVPAFPIYSSAVNTGSYNLSGINEEMTSQLGKKFRNGGQLTLSGKPPDRHYFIVETSQETDYVGFTSIIAKAANEKPISTISGSTLITFKSDNHGYIEGETIHIIGVQGFIGGVLANNINGKYVIKDVTQNTFRFDITTSANASQTGGGSLVRSGREAPFQFQFGSEPNPIADILGFPVENSSISLPISDPLTSEIRMIENVFPGEDITQIVCPEHKLLPGDRIFLHNFHTQPNIYQNELYRGVIEVFNVKSPDVFEIRYPVERVSDITQAYVGTQNFKMYFPGHGFNRITRISQQSFNVVIIETLFSHGFDEKSYVRISKSNSVPSVDGYYKVIVIDSDSFAIRSEDTTAPLSFTIE